jgi:type II secretory pathway pseudopilin PulG
MTKRGGFTLVELLIAIILMMILLSAITLIFMRTTDTVAISEARATVYTNARYALDTMENDLMGCLPFNSGQQRFIMENGRSTTPGAPPTYGVGGNHVGNAADRIIFRTTTTVADTLQTCEVEYCLMPGGQALGPAGGTLPGTNVMAGDGAKNATVNPASTRPLFTLVRRVRVPDPAATSTYSLAPKDKANNVVQDTELCHYVISFNLEYYANNQQFSQLEPSYFTSAAAPGWDPLGNGQGPNDIGAQPYRVPFLRVTLVIVEDVAARQERAVQKTMWIPMG